MFKSKLEKFRLTAVVEGYSYLILLFIAMPIKYIGGEPMVVKIVGMAHGILFMMFLWFQLEASLSQKWGLKFDLYAFIASLLPFGTFFLNKKLIAMKAENSNQ